MKDNWILPERRSVYYARMIFKFIVKINITMKQEAQAKHTYYYNTEMVNGLCNTFTELFFLLLFVVTNGC